MGAADAERDAGDKADARARPEAGDAPPALDVRALFVYLRGSEAVTELQGVTSLHLWLPSRCAQTRVTLAGQPVPAGAEATVELRRERSGCFVSTEPLSVEGGSLPCELGRALPGEPAERWLLGMLHAAPALGAEPASWALEISSTALGSGLACARDVRVTVEVLVVGDSGGRHCVVSAHAPLPTRRARPRSYLQRIGRGRGQELESIGEDEKCDHPLPADASGGSGGAADAAGACDDEAEAPWAETEASFAWGVDAALAGMDAGQPPSELTWFSAGMRLGLGISLGAILGIGLGAGILVNTYRRTSTRLSSGLTHASLLVLGR